MWHTFILKPKDEQDPSLYVYQGWHSTFEKALREVERRRLLDHYDRYQYAAIPWIDMARIVLFPFLQIKSKAKDSQGELIDGR